MQIFASVITILGTRLILYLIVHYIYIFLVFFFSLLVVAIGCGAIGYAQSRANNNRYNTVRLVLPSSAVYYNFDHPNDLKGWGERTLSACSNFGYEVCDVVEALWHNQMNTTTISLPSKANTLNKLPQVSNNFSI